MLQQNQNKFPFRTKESLLKHTVNIIVLKTSL